MYCVHMYLQCTKDCLMYLIDMYLQCREDCFMYCVEMHLCIPKLYSILPYVQCRYVPGVYK